MNKATRAQLAVVRTALETHKSTLEGLSSDERDKFDNLSEGLQASEKGTNLEEAADELDNASNSVDEAVSALDDAINTLDNIP